MDTWPPTTEELDHLPVDQLAIRLLRQLAKIDRGVLHRGNLTLRNELAMYLRISNSNIRIERAIAEAWDWLLHHGLLAREPGQAGDWAYITDRGRKAIDDPNALRIIHAAERINVDLHPLIAQRVRSQFLLGEYEQAVLLAFREVEIRVRDMGGFSNSLIGVPLMRKAFNPDKGKLTNPSLEGGEKQAAMDLFAGAIGAFKNPSSHRQVDYGDATVASEAVLLADLLLRMLDQYETRLGAEDGE